MSAVPPAGQWLLIAPAPASGYDFSLYSVAPFSSSQTRLEADDKLNKAFAGGQCRRPCEFGLLRLKWGRGISLGEYDNACAAFGDGAGFVHQRGRLQQGSAGRTGPGWSCGPKRRRWTRRSSRACLTALSSGRKRPGGSAEPKPSVRIVRSDCVAGCSVQCQDNEILVTAYCGATRNQAQFLGEQGAPCGPVESASNTPLVAVCVGSPP